MSAVEIRRITDRLSVVEGQAQKLTSDMSEVFARVMDFQSETKTAGTAFIDDVQASMGVTITSSLDTVKDRILEELKAYVDKKIVEVTTALLAEVEKRTADVAAPVVVAAAAAPVPPESRDDDDDENEEDADEE